MAALVLAAVAAVAFGASDFLAGVASRRMSFLRVGAITQIAALVVAVGAVLVTLPAAPSGRVLGWGAAAGAGLSVGSLALFRGISRARVAVVAAVSALGSAVIPAIVGVLGGDHLSVLAILGVLGTVPAILLITRAPDTDRSRPRGLLDGVVAGLGFALLFIALKQAGTTSGVWPVVVEQAVAALAVGAALLLHRRHGPDAVVRRGVLGAAAAGVLAGAAAMAYFLAAQLGQLSIVAVIVSLYPAVTVLLAVLLLHERVGRLQRVGLLVAGCAVALIALS